MTGDEAITALKLIANDSDVEAAHSDADNVLRELLESLGYRDVISAYDKIDKWYA